MPELPEVEVILRGLQPYITNKTISSVWYSGKKLRHPFPLRSIEELVVGATIRCAERRAKYLIFDLAKGCYLVVHLGMTGKLGIFFEDVPKQKHDHIIFTLQEGGEIRFNDVRRFGSVQLFEVFGRADLEKTAFFNLGPEPFSDNCSAKYLFDCAQKRAIAVKTLLMDNRVIVGIGNIYANETLFRAGVHPGRPSHSITMKEWQQIHTELITTLKWAIECGGSTINDFLNASGESGYFQANFRVYGRTGKPCYHCNTEIEKATIGGRASFFCNTCQK